MTEFSFRVTRSGEVHIERGGVVVTTLRARAAELFLRRAEHADAATLQGLMQRATGNYKRGNERAAGRHPRNRG